MISEQRLKRSFLEAGLIVLFGTLLGLAYNAFSSRGINLIRRDRLLAYSSDTTRHNVSSASARPILIDIDEAYKLFQEGSALFIDARHDDEFKEGHIKGALCLPLKKLESNPDLVHGIAKDRLIVTYCNGTECEQSLDLGESLAAMGFSNVKVFFAGWIDWQQRHFPTESGEKGIL